MECTGRPGADHARMMGAKLRVCASNNCMIFRAAFFLCLPALAFCSILPDTIGPLTRGDVVAAPAPDVKVWNEYGLQESESAPYTDPATSKKFSITAYRFSDSTGAFAAWIGVRPADARKFEVDGIGVETATEQFIVVGNLLLIFHDFKPDKEQLAHVFLTAPKYSNSPLPTLPGFMPGRGCSQFGTLYSGTGEPGPVCIGNSAFDGGVPLHFRGGNGRFRATCRSWQESPEDYPRSVQFSWH